MSGEDIKGAVDECLKIDPKKVSEKICSFIKSFIIDGGFNGAVIGLSGGIDSSLTAKLTVEAIGADNVLGLIMPTSTSSEEDVKDAVFMARRLGIEYEVIDLRNVEKAFWEICPHAREMPRIPRGNLMARIRMCTLYIHSNSLNRIVVGTGNKSEILTGYFTKYGDGGVDILPIGCLYKTQVRELARYMGIPEKIILKKPSAGLWIGQTDEDELGISYDLLDKILCGIYDLKFPPKKVAEALEIDYSHVQHVMNLVERSAHKRSLPPIPKLD